MPPDDVTHVRLVPAIPGGVPFDSAGVAPVTPEPGITLTVALLFIALTGRCRRGR